MSIRSLELQLDAAQKLYADEASRRDAVRGAIAVPLAVLGFSAFGFGALLTHFELSRASFSAHMLSAGVVGLSFASAVAYALAICALYRIDYVGAAAYLELTDIADQEADLVRLIERREGFSGARALGEARQIALRGASEEYRDRATRQRDLNAANLRLQKTAFRCLLVGVGALLGALVLTGAIDLLGVAGGLPPHDGYL